jgi:hypothetical protein
MIGYAGPDDSGSPTVQEIVPAGVQIQPERKFIGDAGLVKITEPNLFPVYYFFDRSRGLRPGNQGQ